MVFADMKSDVMLQILLLVCIVPSMTVADPCTCGSSAIFTVISSSGCADYRVTPTNAIQSCSNGLIFDTVACSCNFVSEVTCPTGCAPDITTTLAPTTTEVPLCPPEYVLNPFSQTCLRIVTEKENWEGAAGVCDEDDEYLAVFDTVESIEWFKNLRHTNQTWRDAGYVWIGGRKENSWSEFEWFGRLEDDHGNGAPITVGDWESIQPDGHGDCIVVYDNQRAFIFNSLRENYKWADMSCSEQNSFVCEKVEESSGIDFELGSAMLF